MLQCVFLMGNLFVSDGQVMIDMNAMTRVERAGDLLLVGYDGREDGLDVSTYPESASVHGILAACAAEAASADVTVTRASNDFLR